MIFKNLFIYKGLILLFLHHVMLFILGHYSIAVAQILSIYYRLLYFFGPLLKRQWSKKIPIYIRELCTKNAVLGHGRYSEKNI